MGNSRSRQRPPATPEGSQGSQQNPPPPQYTPSQVYRPQQVPPYYSQPQPYLNNGQYYAGWRPPPAPQYPPYPHQPQARLPHQPPYPHPPPNAGGQQPPPGQQPAAQQPAQELTQTATIRNAVNLKKSTLVVTPLEGDPSKLCISFTFDASAPCSVTTFVMATEDPVKGCKLTPAKQLPAPAVSYEKGLGLKFQIPPRPAVAHAAAAPAAAPAEGGSEGAAAQQPPAADAAEQPPQHVIDMSLYSEEALMRHDKDTYPLVIRLETVTDKGLKDGHTLQELVPGAEQKVWVQSQTTFAQLHKEEDGSWVVRVVKQKIWVAGVSYELQEIYGLEQAGGAKAEAAVSAEDAEERLCVICLVNDRDTTVLPCRHMCMCHECAQELRKQTSKCPICRNHVESLLHIKMHGKKPPSASQAAGAAPAAASV